MFDKTPYTPGIREVFKLSKAEAGRLGHDYIGPEHYLLAMIRKGDGLAIEALTNLGIDLEELKLGIERWVDWGKGPTLGLFFPNEEAKKVLEEARNVAHAMCHGWVGTEHLLLALIQIENTIPSKYIRQFSIDFETAKREVVAIIEGRPGEKRPVRLQDLEPFIRVLIDEQKIDMADVERATAEHESTGRPLRRVLADLGRISEEEFAIRFASLYTIPFIRLDICAIPIETLQLIPESIVRGFNVIPLARIGNYITAATPDLANVEKLRESDFARNYRFTAILCLDSDFDRALERYLGPGKPGSE